MKEKDDIDILVNKFVRGEMSEEELSSFNILLEEQPELLEEIEFTRSLVRSAEKIEKKRLYEGLEKAASDFQRTATNIESDKRIKAKPQLFILIKNNGRKLAAIAAGILLLLAVWWLFAEPPETFASFQESAYISPAGSSFRGFSDNPLTSAYRSYESGNHEQSIAYLDEIQRSDSLYILALFLKGHNQYKLKKFEPALSSFDQLLSFYQSDPEYTLPNIDNVKWTKILTLLSLYEIEKNEARKDLLQNELKKFLVEAKPSENNCQKAQELMELLD